MPTVSVLPPLAAAVAKASARMATGDGLMRIAILGCGPAGLMSAHAVSVLMDRFPTAGATFAIYSRKVKSRLYGAQYLHQPIPHMTPDAPAVIDYRMRGTPEQYRAKVYGQSWDGQVSVEDYEGLHYGWDIRATYDALWKVYGGVVNDIALDPSSLQYVMVENDLVINTIPRNMLCFKGHTFGSVDIVAAGDAPDLGIDIGKLFRCDDNTVICNGLENPGWYRLSRVFGHTTVEWPIGKNGFVPVTTASVVRKPTHHDCDCWSKLVHVGRYGSWDKKVLSHHAFNAVTELVGSMLGGKE